MKSKCSYLYECTFHSDKGHRHLLVVADSFGRAAALAHSISNGWEDKDAYELTRICLREVVIVSA